MRKTTDKKQNSSKNCGGKCVKSNEKSTKNTKNCK